MVARDQLLKAIEQVESGGRRDAVSPKGARGRMQVMPATAKQPGYKVKPARDESEEEYTRVGKDYAMALLKHYGGDLEATLVAYNYGPGNANKWIASGRNKSDLPEETRNYITRVGKQLGGKKMATKKELTDQRKALQRKVRSGSATAADKRKLKRVQIELGSKRNTAAKAKAPAPKAKRQKASLQQRLQQLFEDSLPIDEDVAGRALDQGAYAEYPEPQRAALNNELKQSGQKRLESRLRQAQDKTPIAPPGRNPTEAEFTTVLRPGRNPTEAEFATPPRPGRNPTEAEFMYMIGQQRPDPSMMTPPMRRGVSRKSRPTGPSSPEITEAQFSYTDPGTIPTEDQFRAMRARDIDEDVAGRRGLPSLELMSKAPQADGFIGDEPGAPYRSSGGRGEMEGNRGYETLREYFIEDMSPRKSNVMTPFGIIEIDSTQEGMFPEEDMYMEKKGGRLKKKKRVARKKAAPKKKKVAAKKKPVVRKKAVAKKPVVRKKAVAKKPLMRKKTVAKKPAGRKRAAKRGFGAELRGN